MPEASRPRPRGGGPTLPATAGGDLVARGWVKVDDLFWMRRPDADAYVRRGGFPDAPTGTVFTLRTDHVSLRTDVPFSEAVPVAREAEGHVRRLFASWAEPLRLRFPAGPLPVVLHATREGFAASLDPAPPEARAWGAWYDARTGTVHVCRQAAAVGALPLASDLRHEMTHQVLDLSTPPAGRARIFQGHGFWLWEAFAVHNEGARGADELRRVRFEARYARGTWTPLDRLFRLSQAQFEGRHYDQCASLMDTIMEDPDGRAAALAALAALLHGAPGPDLLAAWGIDTPELERRWIASLTRSTR